MKIYRYIYKNKQIKVDEFECEKKKEWLPYFGGIGDENIYYKLLNYGENKKINESELDRIYIGFFCDSDYIMWSLDSNKKQEFISLVLEKKNKMLDNKLKEIETLKKEIEILKGKC